ncbi:MAG: acyl-CoA desaturase [Cytophagales bacterium]|nr:MAG: acyl-CoA desaturase [Cytophagales bacterium]TAF59944.1 MAG: acyl-CoA desaturase [Cytophagales bacterium]
MQQPIRFSHISQREFLSTLRQRVDSYFTDKGISKHGNWIMHFKVIFYIGGMFAFFGALMFGQWTSFWQSLPLWIGLGTFAAFIGLNICHDALHGSYSNNTTLNAFLGKFFNIIGANDYVWKIVHNTIHHTYTNIPDMDEDLDTGGIIRMSPSLPLQKFHRYQHFYALPLYCLASLSWIFRKDFSKIFVRREKGFRYPVHPTSEYVSLFGFKALHFALFFVMPFIIIPQPWWQVLLGMMVMHFFEGFLLTIIFVMAHVVEETHFPVPNLDGEIENNWAVHQLYTTADFAQKNSFLNFIAGGLNFQIEHHLFPHICHVHYASLSRIVENTAREFDLPYINNPTFGSALSSHLSFLKKMGRQECL